jgi:hypothetical protein
MITSGQRLHAMPISAGTSRMSHKGEVLPFMGAIMRPHLTPPI